MSHVIIAMSVKRERMVTVSPGTEYVLCHATHPTRGLFFDLQCNLPTNQPPVTSGSPVIGQGNRIPVILTLCETACQHANTPQAQANASNSHDAEPLALE